MTYRTECIIALASLFALAIGPDAWAQDQPRAKSGEPYASTDINSLPPLTSAAAAPGPWYGWQIMALDLTTVSGLAVAGTTGNPEWALTSLLYLVPSMVHLVHQQPDAALSSITLRTVAPLAGLTVGAAVGYVGGLIIALSVDLPSPPSDPGVVAGSVIYGAAGVGGLIGLSVGMVGAMGIDAALLSEQSGLRLGGPRLAPLIQTAQNGDIIYGLAGRF